MNAPHSSGSTASPNPAGFTRATLLLRQLRLAVEQTLGRQSLVQLGGLLGVPKSTLARWLEGDGQPGAEALLALLEMLPEAERLRLLSTPPYGRTFPTLNHPRLQADEAVLSEVRSILARPSGVVLVTSASREAAAFVVVAMTHRARASGRRVAGLDLHRPDWFVPVPGIDYLDNTDRRDLIAERLRQLSRALGGMPPAGLLVLNGLGGAGAPLENIVRRARKRLLVLASAFPGHDLPPLPGTWHVEARTGPNGGLHLAVSHR